MTVNDEQRDGFLLFRWDLNELKLSRDQIDNGKLFQTGGAQ